MERAHGHHAYVYEGPLLLLEVLVADAEKRFNVTRDGNPDVQVRSWRKFGIDDARELADQAALKSISGHMLFILGIDSLTMESQQALLKLFEEPRIGTTFVLLVPHGALLPTVRSRFLPYPDKLSVETLSQQKTHEAEQFLSWPYQKRSEWITGFLKKDDEATREHARNFLNDLEVLLYTYFSSHRGATGEAMVRTEEVRGGLEDIGHFRPYLSDRSPSLKMILEHFAATLPAIQV